MDSFFEPCRFVEVMLVLMLLINFPYIGAVVKVFMKITPVWAVLILINNIRNIKSVLKQKNVIWIILFLVSYGITILMNYQSNLLANSKALVWFVIYVFILMSWMKLGNYTGIEEKQVCRINWCIIYANLANVVVSVLFYIFNYGIIINETHAIGIYTSRLFGVASGINSSAMVALLSVGSTMMIWYAGRTIKGINKFILSLNIVSSYVYIIASGSRAVRYTMIICASIAGIVIVLRKCQRIQKAVGRAIVSGVLIVIVSVGIYGFVEISRYPIGYLPQIGRSMGIRNIDDYVASLTENSAGVSTGNQTDIGSQTGKDEMPSIVLREESGEGQSNSIRHIIIQECLQLWKTRPLWGIGSANMANYASKLKGEFKYITQECSTHNMPIAVLLFSGISGLFFVGVFLLTKALYELYMWIRNGGKCVLKGVSLLCCMALGIYSLFGTVILFSNVEGTILFWIFLGFMNVPKQEIRDL